MIAEHLFSICNHPVITPKGITISNHLSVNIFIKHNMAGFTFNHAKWMQLIFFRVIFIDKEIRSASGFDSIMDQWFLFSDHLHGHL